MDKRAIQLIINELQEKIEREKDNHETEAVRTLEEFYEWFLDMFVL